MLINEIARVCHTVNQSYCEALGDFSQVEWEKAPKWQKESAIAGVLAHMEVKDRSPEESHNAWVFEKLKTGWTYGALKNEEFKTHPCLVPFSELSREQKAKDFIFTAIIRALDTSNN